MTDKVALVTGSLRGIGAACARKLHKKGIKVALHYRTPNKSAEKIKEELFGSQLYQYDLSKVENCQNLIKDIKKDFGRLDILVNNAGIAIDQLLIRSKATELEKVFNTNFSSVFHLVQASSRLMLKQKNGSIINVTSVVGHTGNAGQSMYAASKAAISGFTKSIAQELGSRNIRCNCVAPGFIDTEMTSGLSSEIKEDLLKKIPLNRLGSADDVAKVVAFLSSDDASYITGSTIHVNGGMYTN